MLFFVDVLGREGKFSHCNIRGQRPRCLKCRTPLTQEQRRDPTVPDVRVYYCASCKKDVGQDVRWESVSARALALAESRFMRETKS